VIPGYEKRMKIVQNIKRFHCPLTTAALINTLNQSWTIEIKGKVGKKGQLLFEGLLDMECMVLEIYF